MYNISGVISYSIASVHDITLVMYELKLVQHSFKASIVCSEHRNQLMIKKNCFEGNTKGINWSVFCTFVNWVLCYLYNLLRNPYSTFTKESFFYVGFTYLGITRSDIGIDPNVTVIIPNI